MPVDHEQYYGFTKFAIELNELEPSVKVLLPPTDTRLRVDQRSEKNHFCCFVSGFSMLFDCGSYILKNIVALDSKNVNFNILSEFCQMQMFLSYISYFSSP